MTEHDDKKHVKEFTIYVNTHKTEVQGPTISFEDVVQLAYPGQSGRYSVSYSGGKGGKDGILLPGRTVPLENDMMFDVTPTDKS